MEHSEHAISHYMPHGHCYLWEPALVGTHVISDLLIGLAYLSISISLYLLIRKIKMPFSFIILAFGVFIGACGLTHFMEIWNLWKADYWLGGWIKVLTAAASVYTSVALVRLSPKIVAFAAAAKLSEERGLKLEAAYTDMEARVQERTQELELANARERSSKEQIEGLYESAKKASQLKDEFLANMSHELRTPISVIMGYADLLEKKELGAAEQEQAIATIRRNAHTQFQLVKDLLDVSMIISGKMQLNPKVIDVRQPVEDALESVGLAAKAKNIDLTLECGNSVVAVLGDVTRIQQIVWNLVSNAIKFTEKGGKVKVRVFSENSRCCIEVLDSGQGIDPSFLPHIFERFRQEDAGSNRKFGGLGLGLGIVRHLTELHGGSVTAKSEGKGTGTEFLVTLPLSPFSPHEQNESSVGLQKIGPEPLTGIKILIIDDEKDVRNLIATLFQKSGMQTETAGSAAEALAKLASYQPQAIVCDIAMPGTDGFSLIRLIRDQELKNGGFTPALALTAFAQDSIRQKVLSAGFQSYLSKPAAPQDLLGAIRRLVQPD